jgi:hypothetical protein
LFNENDTPDDPAKRLQRCMKRDVVHGRMGSDWREVQANMGMAAVLMPRSLLISASQRELVRVGVDRVLPDTALAATLASRLATAFQVSCQAASIRLKTLGILATPGQQCLM